MMKTVSLVSFLGLFISTTAMACLSELELFLGNPNAEHHSEYVRKLEDAIKSDNYKNCGMPFSNENLNTILSLIDKKNVHAFDITFRALSFSSSGGNYEDMIRALGSFSEHNPKLFLSYINKHKLSHRRHKTLLTMLPLITVDDFELKLSMISKRITSVRSIADRDLEKVKKASLEILYDFRKRTKLFQAEDLKYRQGL